jgi:phage nucleotide-binding protein
MILPKAERRQVGQTTKRKLWIYGGAFSGKTTFMDSAPMPLNLNTDGNIQFVTMQYLSIKDTYEGRQKVLAWENFKKVIDELEKKDNDFKTIIVDLLEDTYESCRLYMYDKLGITHESDDSFRAWDKVRTEFLSTIRKLMNLDYENIVLISHEDTTKDITKKSGDKITAIKPNIADKVANKIAGMVDIVARVVVEDDDSRTLNFKSNEVIFGGGRLKGISKTQIPLDWDALCEVYDEANAGSQESHSKPQDSEKEKVDTSSPVEEKAESDDSDKPQRTSRRTSRTKKDEGADSEQGESDVQDAQNQNADTASHSVEGAMNPPEQEEEKPARTRRTRKTRGTE